MAEVAQALETSNVTSIKSLAESPGLNSVPSAYSLNMNPKSLAESPALNSGPSAYSFSTNNPNDEADPNDPEFAIPIVDMSLLTSGSPNERAKIVCDLAKICEEWGFFIVINHGVEESLMKGMFEAFQGFFSLPEEEKKEFNSGNDDVTSEMFKYGTSYDLKLDKILLWRDFMRFQTHPEFYSLSKPAGISEISLEYSKKARAVALEITRAISESLQLEPEFIYNTMNLDRGLQVLAGNYYPPCPEPEHAIGLPPHTDNGLFTMLFQNDLNGLQIERNGKWLSVTGPKNCYFINLADQMQILTNGKYKSSLHRVTVKNTTTRMTIPLAHGPSIDTIIAPLPELCERYGEKPKYIGMNYKEYMDLQYSGKCYMKSKFDHIRA